jgi:hypothetical protein
MPRNRVLAADISLPAETLIEIYDSFALALDAITAPRLTERNLSEARTYLRDALRQIGGAA